jgi:hypothetical protein
MVIRERPRYYSCHCEQSAAISAEITMSVALGDLLVMTYTTKRPLERVVFLLKT